MKLKLLKKLCVPAALAAALCGFSMCVEAADYNGGYMRVDQYAHVRYNAWLHTDQQSDNSWGEFIVSMESGYDGSLKVSRFIGELTEGQKGGTFLRVRHEVVRKFSQDGKPLEFSRKRVNNLLELAPVPPQGGFLLKPDGPREAELNYDFLGEYEREKPDPVMSEDVAVFLIEQKARLGYNIPLEPDVNNYTYKTVTLYYDENQPNISYLEAMREVGRRYIGGVVVWAYDNTTFMGTYFVSRDGRDILFSDGGRYRLVWSADPVG